MASVQLHGKKYRGVYYDPVVRKNRYAGTFASKRQAQRAANAAELKLRSGTYRDPDAGNITYADYFENHWLPHKRGEQNTLASHRNHYNRSIREEFGSVRLKDITPEKVQQWVTRMIDCGTNPNTLHKRVYSLSAVLGGKKGMSAMRSGRIESNPCASIELPVVPTREPDVYTPQQGHLLFQRLPAWYRPLAILAADTGWRWGELNGLWVADFTADFSVVRLSRTLLEIPVKQTGLATPFSYKDYPKEKRKRDRVELSPEVAASIRLVVESQGLLPGDRLFSVPADRACSRPKRTELWPTGQPISRGNFRSRHWLPAHVDPETGVEDIPVRRFHDLRGSHISWLLAAGVDVTAVMQRVGHTQWSTTQRYVDALPDANARALRGMAAVRASMDGAQLA